MFGEVAIGENQLKIKKKNEICLCTATLTPPLFSSFAADGDSSATAGALWGAPSRPSCKFAGTSFSVEIVAPVPTLSRDLQGATHIS